MKLCKTHINFLGVTLGNGRIKLQLHIEKKVLDMPDRLDNTKDLQKNLGLVNYARNFIQDLGKIAGPLYAKKDSKGQKHFNIEDIKLVQQSKEKVKNIPNLKIPLESYYLIVQTDGSKLRWRDILKAKPNKYSSKNEEKICAYQSGLYKEKENMNSIDLEVQAIIYGLDSFKLYILNKEEVLVRTDCEAIVKFHQKINDKASSRRRWLNFMDTISVYKNILFEYGKEKDNELADQLSRLQIKTKWVN